MSSSSTAAGATRPWRLARRNRIVQAAAELLRQASAEAVQIDDIVGEAGVGRATFYRYFASKDELFAECFERALSALHARLTAVAAAATSPSDELRRMIEALVEMHAEHFTPQRRLARSRAELSRRRREAPGGMRARVVALLRANLERGVAGGHYRPDLDLDAMPVLLIDMVRAGLMHLPDLPVPRISGAIANLVLDGVLAPPVDRSGRSTVVAGEGRA